MRVSSVIFAVVAATLTISVIGIWFYPSVQDFMASNNMWNGIRDFSREFGAEQIDSLNDVPDLPEQVVIVAIPYLRYTDRELARLERFVDDGGMLLLTDDFGYGNDVLAYLGVGARFSGKPLLDPLFCYKNQWMPRITDFAPGIKESGTDSVTLNHATTLANVAAPEAIAWSSSASFLDLNEDGEHGPDEPEGPFAIAAEFRLGRGAVVVISDPSVMINTMVGRDNNYAFVRYLTRHGNGQKTVLIDRSHLAKAPLDVSKTRLIGAREALSSPYALLGITAAIFVMVSWYTLGKEELIG